MLPVFAANLPGEPGRQVMRPLKILAFVIGAIPIAVFLLALYLTDGAPLQPLTPGEESGPAAATRALPLAKLKWPAQERQGSVLAGGLGEGDGNIAEYWDAEGAFAPADEAVPARMINHDRDAQLFITLFGAPRPKPLENHAFGPNY